MRVAQLKPLAALAGRLDLLVAHLPKPDSAASADTPELPGPEVSPPSLKRDPREQACHDFLMPRAGQMMA